MQVQVSQISITFNDQTLSNNLAKETPRPYQNLIQFLHGEYGLEINYEHLPRVKIGDAWYYVESVQANFTNSSDIEVFEKPEEVFRNVPKDQQAFSSSKNQIVTKTKKIAEQINKLGGVGFVQDSGNLDPKTEKRGDPFKGKRYFASYPGLASEKDDAVVLNKDESNNIHPYNVKIFWEINLKRANVLDWDAPKTRKIIFVEYHPVEGKKYAAWKLMAYISTMSMPFTLGSESDKWRQDEVIKRLASDSFHTKKMTGSHVFRTILRRDREDRHSEDIIINIRLTSFRVDELALGFLEIKPAPLAQIGSKNISHYLDHLSLRITEYSTYNTTQAALASHFESLIPAASANDIISRQPKIKDFQSSYIEFLREGFNRDFAKAEAYQSFFSNDPAVRKPWVDDAEEVDEKVTSLKSWSKTKGFLAIVGKGIATFLIVPRVVACALDIDLDWNEYAFGTLIGPRFKTDLISLQRGRKPVTKGEEYYQEYIALIKDNIDSVKESLDSAGKRMLHLRALGQDDSKEIEAFKEKRQKCLSKIMRTITSANEYIDPNHLGEILNQLNAVTPIQLLMGNQSVISFELDEKKSYEMVEQNVKKMPISAPIG